MINVAVEYQQQCNSFIENFPGQLYGLELSGAEWGHLKNVCTVLKHFNDVTKQVSNKSPQLSFTLPLYYEMSDFLNNIQDRVPPYQDMDDIIVAAVAEGLVHFNKYYTMVDGNDTYFIACILDPRFKTTFLYNHLEHDVADNICSVMKSKLKEQYPAPPQTQTQPTGNSILSRITRVTNNTRKSDIDVYFDTPVIELDESSLETFDLIGWWRDHQRDFPLLARAARDYLAIPLSSIDAERLFSKSSDVISSKRYSLHAETITSLMMSKSHYDQ
ncbi:hypothetical protein AKO1_002311 [Acrasis kona]|uniref:HAT C-terminal dimerisation domain-containing protein n=1 Tax=Acrasis kona TaxID=1008807 RepID=A0AAW2ZMY8_9EUKA